MRHASPKSFARQGEFDGDIGGHTAHELLHTTYKSRKRVTNLEFEVRESVNHKVMVKVCVGTNCYLKGSQDLLKKLKKRMHQRKNLKIHLQNFPIIAITTILHTRMFDDILSILVFF